MSKFLVSLDLSTQQGLSTDPLSAQWMQWLRHTRPDAPTLAEQQADIFRQQQMKQLAAQADARWAAKPSFLDAPDKQQPTQMLQSRDPTSGIRQTAVDHESQPSRIPKEVEDVKDEPEQSNDAPALKTRKLRSEPKARDSPWEQATKRNSGDEWTPAAWSPAPARKRA
jgi:NADH dehydrogenase [ubiquinone] 1 alpha subcomplex assembly factor 2